MMKRETFLQAVSKNTIEDFLCFAKLHQDVFDPFDLNELLQELPRKQKEILWERLKHLLTQVLVENAVEEWQSLGDESDNDMETEGTLQMKQIIAVIQGVTTVVASSVPVVDENINYKALLECALILNGILYALPESERILQGAIQHLCEIWWKKGLEEKEQLGKTAFIILLRKSLKSKIATGADVSHLWHLHQALLCFDYDLEESNEVKDLLLQCFMSVTHIKKEEGRRFLSFLFSWNVNFIKMIHGTIKNQLQCFPKSLVMHVAEIYFRAWKKASGEILETLEYNCIQDFMHHGIHLPRNSPVHPKVREVLSYFHKQSKVREGVEEMLYRLYQPILWRALKARNSEVRANAALLFVEAFPIRDPHFNNEEMDNDMQKHFEELFSLLEDPHPLVRSIGVLGVSKITSKYWEMIPATIIADLLNKLIGDLAFDVTSADVRCSVFKCLPIILENALSHPLLEQLLPAVKYSLHDNSEKVRVAFVDMLLKIKAARAAKFWKICPMDHLLTRLEVDSRPVSRRIVNLLFNSFLPVNQPEEVWCERCVTLIQMNSAAARKFYQYAYEYTAPTNIAKLMLTIRRCLNACIQRSKENQSDDDKDEESEKENISVLNNVLSVNDATSMASLLEISVILWRSIHKALNQNEEAKVYTIRKFASVLPEYFKVFKDDRCVIPLIILASFMPASAIPTFSCGVISKLRNLQKGADENKYSTLIDCLCRWGQVGHVVELICDWISDELTPKKNVTASGRRVCIQVTQESKPELALDYVEYLLTHSMNRDCLLSIPKKKLSQLLKALAASQEVLGSILKATDTNSQSTNQAISLRAFTLYCRLSIHLQHKFSSDGEVYLSLLKETAAWIESQVLPSILMDEQEADISTHIEVSQLIIQTYLTVCKDVVMVGLGDSEFRARLLDFTLSVIQTERGYFSIPSLLCVLKEITEASLAQNIDTNEEVAALLHAVQTVFQKALECVARRLKKQREEGLQLIHSIQVPLGEFVHTVQCWHSACPAVHHGVLSTLLAATVVEISHMLQKTSNEEEFTSPGTISDLPPLSNSLMAIIIKSTNIVRSFLNELMECIVSEEIEGIVSLAAAAYIIVVIKGKHKASLLKDVASALQKKLMTYKEVAMEVSSSTERILYESSMKILDERLKP
ncbi:condensin-2 complex subunit G2 [Alligator mississippiensis]|uniref:Condensin-2 complex subunit G2 n=1 Tax=Alligator mississippiensis TaxID=8496 RepID=A0A151PCU4_ALLMI|nr:condensin-2 complex subunit G2 [Alligator mississippiensis]XP_019354298.1 condensin-2 complex subunit G2 [Alligator mississippiensis]XP_019354308.1 condensin-2 complex subunit G2 [Alligator mississippiensis]KYO46926.1 condensin-2 complex subunit G2 [Alligator mississippiensis]